LLNYRLIALFVQCNIVRWTAERQAQHLAAERKEDERCFSSVVDSRRAALQVLNAESQDRAVEKRRIRKAIELQNELEMAESLEKVWHRRSTSLQINLDQRLHNDTSITIFKLSN